MAKSTASKVEFLEFDDSEKPKKYKFVVKAGRTFGVDRQGPGTVVELTVREALAFADLLEPEERNKALPTARALVEAGVERVSNPSGLTTDRQDMTPKQRAETSQLAPAGGATATPTDTSTGQTRSGKG